MLAQWHQNRPELFVQFAGQWWFCLLPRPDEAPLSPLAAHREKVEAEIQDAWERESLSDLCLIARRLLWGAVPDDE